METFKFTVAVKSDIPITAKILRHLIESAMDTDDNYKKYGSARVVVEDWFY